MEKITYSKMCEILRNHNLETDIRVKGVDKNPLYGVVVFTEDTFSVPYTLEERSYRVSSDNKAFIYGMISNSVFANCLDGKDNGVRLDCYIGDWKVDYCYMEDKNE